MKNITMKKKIIYDNEELELLQQIENCQWKSSELSKKDIEKYKQSALYTKSLNEKTQTRFELKASKGNVALGIELLDKLDKELG